jgi:hypothetical protein
MTMTVVVAVTMTMTMTVTVTVRCIQSDRFNHKVAVLSGVREAENAKMLSNFFKEKRDR